MSTVLMSQNTMYEFGDNLLKNGVSNSDMTTAHLTVGSNMRLSLSRMASTPGSTASTNLAMLLGNMANHRRLERTQSAPAPAVQVPSAAVSATTVNTSRYKTELCRPYEEFGVCKYGDKCQFAHGMNELRSLARHPKYKTELCRTYHTVGFCPYGPRCHFVHNQDEVVMQKSPPMGRSNGNKRPAALSPSLSLESPSSPCSLSSSLSQSPTGSMKFFGSESELHSPGIEDQRLPVFNSLSTAQILTFKDLIM